MAKYPMPFANGVWSFFICIWAKAGERLAASYVNFYFANGVVILPGFGVPEDEAALRLFEVGMRVIDRALPLAVLCASLRFRSEYHVHFAS